MSKATTTTTTATATTSNSNEDIGCVAEVKNEEEAVTVAQDLIAGGVAGSASVIIGHPFDTYKVRLQTSSGKSKHLIGGAGGGAASSIGSLFRGMTAPLSTAAIINAVIFGSFGASGRLWDHFQHYFIMQENIIVKNNSPQLSTTKTTITTQNEQQQQQQQQEPPWVKLFFCGSAAGAVQCLIVCPMEHVKCRMQVLSSSTTTATTHPTTTTYRGPIQTTIQIIQSHGIRGLYRGWCATCWREIPAFGCYFAGYDGIKHFINSHFFHDQSSQSSSSSQQPHGLWWLSSAIAGAIAGSLSWAIVYPFDVIKSKIQTSPLLEQKKQQQSLRMWAVGQDIVRQYGWNHFFRGFGVTVFRAIPVNAIIFPVYEFTLDQLTRRSMFGP